MSEVEDGQIVETPPEAPKEEPKEAPEVKQTIEQAIALSEGGLLQPKDSKEAWRVAQMFMRSAAIPKGFKSPEQVLMAIQCLKELNLNPVTSLRQIAVINGSISIWGELPKALVERAGIVEDFEEFVFDAEYKKICFENKNLGVDVFGAYCRMKRKDRPTEYVRTFTIADAKTAGLWGKDGPWKTYPRRMLQMRARSWVLKDAAPDVLQGVAIAEYDHNSLVDVGRVANAVSGLAEELNKRYLNVPQAEANTKPEGAR